MIYFNDSELACKGTDCCGGSRPHNQQFEYKLDMVRHELNKPLLVLSGFRCNKHNQLIGGVENSLHTKMKAADCTTYNKKDLSEIERIGKKYFKEVIVYADKNFVHLGDE